jgi:hypothetical protein
VNPSDLALFNQFMPPGGEEPTLDLHAPAAPQDERKGTNLADLILKEIAAHEARQGQAEGLEEGVEDEVDEIPAKVVEVYSK